MLVYMFTMYIVCITASLTVLEFVYEYVQGVGCTLWNSMECV